MLKANERRQKILEILCVRRQETMENLAQEFNVTTRTIRNDIEELTLNIGIPIEGFTAEGIKNLIYMIHSKQYLLEKAVGKEVFRISVSW